jgi:hypothetical protein
VNDTIDCRILFDTGASKSYMSLTFFKQNCSLQDIKKFTCTGKQIRVGNGALIPIKFAIPILLTIQSHTFEIFCLVADICNSTDIVWGIKNMYETEGIVYIRHSKYQFLNRSLPVFPSENMLLKPGDLKILTLHIPFSDTLNGKAIVKVFNQDQPSVSTTEIILHKNVAIIEICNKGQKPFTIQKQHAIGIVDIRSLGYYKIEMQTLENKLNSKYHFDNLFHLCDQVNKLVDDINYKYKPVINDPYPWLEQDDWRRFKTDKEILDTCINLTNSKLSCREKKKVMQMVYKHSKAFSIRDEIGECPNITVDIEVLDGSPFFVRPFNIKEEDKPTMDWQMDRLVHLGVLTKQSTSHSSPVMLISRKLTADKRPVVDFRLLNSRIVRRNTTTPLMRDIFNTLGRASIELLSCIDLKDAYHSIKLSKEAKELCGIVPYFGAPCYRFERMPQGLSISHAKWIEC